MGIQSLDTQPQQVATLEMVLGQRDALLGLDNANLERRQSREVAPRALDAALTGPGIRLPCMRRLSPDGFSLANRHVRLADGLIFTRYCTAIAGTPCPRL